MQKMNFCFTSHSNIYIKNKQSQN